MVEGSVPPALDGLDQDAATTYLMARWELFGAQMACSRGREELLAFKDDALGCRVGQNIASLMAEGRDFQSAVLQVGSNLAASCQGGTVIRDVVELVKRVMFLPSSVGADAGQSSRSGSRSAVGGELRSRAMKIDSLAIVGCSSFIPARPLPSSEVSFLASDVVSNGVDVRCPAPVCVNAPMVLSDALVEGVVGEIVDDSVDSAGAGSISLQVCAPSLDATGAGEMIESVPAVPVKVKGDSADEQSVVCAVGSGLDGLGVATAVSLPMGGSPSCAVLMPSIQDQGGSEAVCCNADVVMNPVAESLAKDYLPPAPGVGLQEWVRVAKDNRKGKKKRGNKSAVEMGMLGAKAVVVDAATSADDPFPPLSRAPSGPAGIGLASNNGESVEAFPSLDVGKKFSWKELVRSTKPANVDVDLHFVEPTQIDGEPCAVFSVEEEVENMREWQHTLLCYVVGKSPSYYQFLKVVQRLWKAPGGIEVFLRENGLFYCRFSCDEDLRRVIKNGPWYMEGKLIVVKKFEGATNCEEDMLSSIPIWVKLPCLPVQWWSIPGVSKVVSPIGYPLYFDVPSASQSRISYARCCVEVAMEKPLPDFVTCIGGDKVRRRQKISYDWVPKKCSNCKEFGHLVVDCYKTKNHVLPKTQMDGSKGKAKVGEQQSDVPICNRQNPVIENPIVKASRASSSNPIVGGSFHAIHARGKHSYFLSDEEPNSGDDQSVDSLQHVCDDKGDPKNEGVEGDLLSVSSSGDKEVGGVDNGLSILPCDSEDLESKEIKEIESGNEDVAEPKTGSIHGGLDYMEDNMKEKKVKRIRKKPAPIRPEGSRITRHSGNMPTT